MFKKIISHKLLIKKLTWNLNNIKLIIVIRDLFYKKILYECIIIIMD